MPVWLSLPAEELAQSQPQDPALRLKLARLYVQSGQDPKAVNQYEMCLRLDAMNREAQKEHTALMTRLKASGQLSSVSLVNALLSASNAEPPQK